MRHLRSTPAFVSLLPAAACVLAFVSMTACSGGGSAHTPGAAGTSGAGTSGGTGSVGTSGGAGSAGTSAGAGSVGTSGGTGSAGISGGTGSAASGAQGSAGVDGAGTTDAAGGAGEAGAAEGSDAAGATGAAGADGGTPSDGCGMAAGQALGTYVKYMEMVTGVTAKQAPRNYYVWLPTDYNPLHAYTLVFIGPGCGSNGMQGIQIQSASGNNAIVVGLDPSMGVDPEGRQCFDSQDYPDPEVPYFDQTLKAIESNFCVDKSHIFMEGFSSGSWLTNLIGCVDADVIRGQGNASGCLQGLPAGTCTKPIAYMEVHNNPDPNNSYACGTQNRDEKIMRNGCTQQTMPFTPTGLVVPAGATVSCVQYVGCKPGYPVIFCTTTGVNPQHNPGDNSTTHITTDGMWNLWMSLPPASP
jgi:polyhydroxybutyrate depolymerase